MSEEAGRQFKRCEEIEQTYQNASLEEQQAMIVELDQMTLTIGASKLAAKILEHIGVPVLPEPEINHGYDVGPGII